MKRTYEEMIAKAKAELEAAEKTKHRAEERIRKTEKRIAELTKKKLEVTTPKNRADQLTLDNARWLADNNPRKAASIMEFAEAVIKNRGSKAATQSIRDWYQEYNPEEYQLPDMHPTLTFEEVAEAMLQGEDFYETFGSIDSVPRENIFAQMADEVYHVDYDAIYYTWLAS